MSKLPVVERFLFAIVAGDTASAVSLCSSDFGVHDGRRMIDWIKLKESEYAIRASSFGVGSDVRLVRVRGLPGSVSFAVMAEDGTFLYEDSIVVGNDGLIVGNGRRFEVVTKLLFEQGRKTARRGVEIRATGVSIELVQPVGFVPISSSFSRSMTFGSDSFHSYVMEVNSDDVSCRVMDFHFVGSGPNGVFEVDFPVWMRGVDDPFFVGGLFPEIDGFFVTLPQGMRRYWSLSVSPDRPSLPFVVERPEGGSVVECPWPVDTAVITDPLDNEWTTMVRHEVY
jgi:hypothetical protein